MSDPRFARLKTDPRFRRPKKHQSKVVVDERFKSVFAPKKSTGKKGNAGRVDKYGRPLADTHDEDNLRRFYRLENENEDDGTAKVLDYARGGVLMESSDEESAGDEKDEKDISDVEGFVTVGHDPSRPIPVTNDEAEIDLDEDSFADLDAQAAAYAKAHPDIQAEGAEKTNRLAIVNLDWEHVRAVHLFKICSSLVSPTAPTLVVPSSSRNKDSTGKRPTKGMTIARGRVLSVKVYPSQFGKERIAREEKEGPPPEVFGKRRTVDDEDVNEKTIYELGDENDFDGDALRKYQLERLRYYYAIVTCDMVEAASHIYNELDGTELERSANIFDISFVPNGMTFDDEPRDEATEDVETGYKAVDFVTDALRHSKVKLTWDEDDPERNQMTRRTITRKELDDAKFSDYIASASSESESETTGIPKRNGLGRDKLRSLLLGDEHELPEGWDKRHDKGDDLDMEVTFTPGLADRKDEDETTLERYQRKLREKRKKRKEESIKTKLAAPELEDDFFDAASDEEQIFDKELTRDKSCSNATKEELSLLVGTDEPGDEPQHFNLKAIMKAERKKKGRKREKKKVLEEENEIQEDFSIDVKDDRFKAIHEDHNFAIDPTNPQFKKTRAMEALLNERSQRKSHAIGRSSHAGEEDTLKSLAERVKRKGIASTQSGRGKRQRVG
ncbi:pre-rrna-processing protein esf1 [Moniliophthora roreri]|nr:pre-rrna-processing protein esf1 [Moniliophthora roreri]